MYTTDGESWRITGNFDPRCLPPQIAEEYDTEEYHTNPPLIDDAVKQRPLHPEAVVLAYTSDSAQEPERVSEDSSPWRQLADLFSRHRNRHESRGSLGLRREAGDPELPIYTKKEEIMHAIAKHDVVLLTSDTGSGKTTQVPLWAVENGMTVWHGHPRRYTTEKTYLRHREHFNDASSDKQAAQLVNSRTGIRGLGPDTARLSNMTTELMVKRLLNGKNRLPDNLLIVIDEAHEENLPQEMLHVVLTDPRLRPANVKVLIMTATGNMPAFQSFYEDALDVDVPIIHSPGRTFPIDRQVRPKSNVVQEAVKSVITKAAYEADDERSRGILVFLDGKKQIREASNRIRKQLPNDVRKQTTILPLHSELSPAKQHAASVEDGTIRVILSTNMAETGVTLPIDVVIDGGTKKQTELDAFGNSGLHVAPISQSEMDQRAGRAGRTAPGTHIHTSWDGESDFVPYNKRDTYPTPEILRTNLTKSVLDFAAAGINMLDVRMKNQPLREQIKDGQEVLQMLGALDDSLQVTELGRRMNAYPLSPALARMMVAAEEYGEDAKTYMAYLCAANEAGGMPSYSSFQHKPWEELTQFRDSDLLADMEIFLASLGDQPSTLIEHDLNVQNVKNALTQIDKILRIAGLPAGTKPLEGGLTQEMTDMLKQCIIKGHAAGIYLRMANGRYRRIGREDIAGGREISRQSQLRTQNPIAIVGTSFRIAGDKKDANIIQHGTAIKMEEIGKALFDLSDWDSELVFKEGIFYERRRQSIYGELLPASLEFRATASPKLYEQAITQLKTKPGRCLQFLRQIEQQCRELNQVAPLNQRFKGLDNDGIDAIIQRAVKMQGIDPAIPSQIDAAIGMVIGIDDITISTYVDEAKRQKIRAEAPSVIKVAGQTYGVDYEKGRAVIKHFDRQTVLNLQEHVTLPNGRPVYFRVIERRGSRDVVRYYDLFQLQTMCSLGERVLVNA